VVKGDDGSDKPNEGKNDSAPAFKLTRQETVELLKMDQFLATTNYDYTQKQ